MRYFPLFYDLKDRKVVVVGGGEEALRKVRLLLKTSAQINVIAAELHQELASESRVNWLSKVYHGALLNGAALVLSADANLNERVSRDASEHGIPVNAVDQAEISTFIVPSIVDRDPVVVAIGSEGTAPILAQRLRANIDAMLPQNLGVVAKRAGSLRDWVAEKISAGAARRAFWSEFFFGSAQEALLENDEVAFKLALDDAAYAHSGKRIGRVSLVGAGPGDPELLTLKAQRKMIEADTIVYDRLVSASILEMARRDAVRIPVGKTPYEVSPKQSDINEILLREAKAGKNVVRLKGGDPYIFGRGGEEQNFLEQHGIAVDVVPGITAALGCAASAKLPLTQRGQNTSITLLTASSETGLAEQDWAHLAQDGSVFAVYMGVQQAGAIAGKLLDQGLKHSTPVTVVENGTLPNERVLETTVGGLWEALQLNGVSGPALIYVGLGKAKDSAEIVPFPIREDIRDAILKAAS